LLRRTGDLAGPGPVPHACHAPIVAARQPACPIALMLAM
jgi:hypothetical protein